MASQLPWFRFHQDDWLAHARLRRCSVEARGVWIDLICMMRQEASGTIECRADGLARAVGLDVERFLDVIDELEVANVAEVRHDGAMLFVTSRRVTRDLEEEERERDLTAERTREYRARLRDAAVTPTKRSRDAAVTPESKSQIENQKKTPTADGLRTTPTTQTSDGIRAGAREPESEVGGREVPKAKTGDAAPPRPAGTACSCVDGFDAAAGQCCRRCERGRERARRVTTAARADDAQQARASRRERPPSTPAPPSYRDLVAKIAQPDARQAASPRARAPPTAQVAP